MTAPIQTRTTIGQLVYRSVPPIDFDKLTADLDTALVGCNAGGLSHALERDGLAIIDIGGSRVGIALARGLDSKGAAAVTVTVGHGPFAAGDLTLARRQSVLARLIAHRIAASFPPLETVWSETPEITTTETFERLREELIERRRVQAELREARAEARRSYAPPAMEAQDVSRMFARFEATLDARRSGRGELALAGVSMGALAREAAPTVAEGHRSRPLLRLAAHMMDATLMVIALPVGVAMMVYSLSRGGDVNTSARAMALSGLGLGVLHLMGSTEALQILVL